MWKLILVVNYGKNKFQIVSRSALNLFSHEKMCAELLINYAKFVVLETQLFTLDGVLQSARQMGGKRKGIR